MLNLTSQGFAGFSALGAEFAGQFADGVEQRLFAFFQITRLGFPVAQLIQIMLGAGTKGVDLFNRIAIFAFETGDQIKALFNFLQPLWVEFQVIGIILHGARQVRKLFEQCLPFSGDIVHVGVNPRQPFDPPHRFTDEIKRTGHFAFAFAEDRLGSLRQFRQCFGIPQPTTFTLQFALFASL